VSATQLSVLLFLPRTNISSCLLSQWKAASHPKRKNLNGPLATGPSLTCTKESTCQLGAGPVRGTIRPRLLRLLPACRILLVSRLAKTCAQLKEPNYTLSVTAPAQSHLLPYYHALPHSASQTSHASFSEPRSSAMTSSLNQQSTRSIETTFPQTSQRSTAQSSDSYSSSFNPPSSSNQQWPVSVPYFTLPPVPTSSSSASPTSSQSSSHSTPAVPSTRQPFSSWAEYYPPPPQALPPIREYLSSLSTSLSDQRPGSSSSASYGHPPAWPSPGLPAAGRSSPYTQTTSAGDETAVASTSATAAQSPGPPDTSPSAKERQRVIVACLAWCVSSLRHLIPPAAC
jgi:hypothetical protein